MSKKLLKRETRKAIFVDGPTFERFRKKAKVDGRNYSPYLDRLMDKEEGLHT